MTDASPGSAARVGPLATGANAASHPLQEFFTISRPMLEALVRASKSYYGTPGPGKERPHANSCGCGICEARRWAEGVLNGT